MFAAFTLSSPTERPHEAEVTVEAEPASLGKKSEGAALQSESWLASAVLLRVSASAPLQEQSRQM